jgi:cation:H+ antiporter
MSAFIKPLPLQLLSIKFDLPVMIAAAVSLIAMAWDGVLSRFEGAILLGGALVYTIVLVHLARRERGAIQREFAQEYRSSTLMSSARSAAAVSRDLGLMICGIGVTVWGADLLVKGAVDIARLLGVSDVIIGLTIVAIGTSAPELATTVVATFKDERDVAVGNLVGSSIYNILAILGATCIAASDGIHVSREILLIDLPLAAAVAIVCAPVFTSDRLISRWEGAFFVACYLSYLGWLVFIRA